MIHTQKPSFELSERATLAFKAALNQISAIELKEIDSNTASQKEGMEGIDILARIEVYCHCHKLACKVLTFGTEEEIRAAIDELNSSIACMDCEAIPVLIAPLLSPEAQAFCLQNKAGFIDLEGNVRLTVDQVFVAKRSLSHRSVNRSASAARAARTRGSRAKRIPPASVGTPRPGAAVSHGD